jgi:hypothetical protein
MRMEFSTGNIMPVTEPSILPSEGYLKSAEKTTATVSDVMETNGLKLGQYTDLQVSKGAPQFEKLKTPDDIKTPKKHSKLVVVPEASDPPHKKLKLADTSPASAKVTTSGIATSPCHYKYLCRGQRYLNPQF